MSEQKIPNVLTAEEWAKARDMDAEQPGVQLVGVDSFASLVDGLVIDYDAGFGAIGISDSRAIAQLIALANAALPDSDPRKITRAKVEAMRDALDETDNEVLRTFADALESYLPPEGA